MRKWFNKENPLQVEHIGFHRKYKVTSMAFVTVSLEKGQSKSREIFEDIGFKFTPFVHNTKNVTWVSFGIISVKDLIKGLEKVGEEEQVEPKVEPKV